jgi:hypothetical protein
MVASSRSWGGSSGSGYGVDLGDSGKGPTAPDHPIPIDPRPAPRAVTPGDSDADGHSPSISVIVAAHLRREYLVDAVKSVVSSGLPPNQLDIVVTKAYRSDEQDEELQRLGARIYLDFDVGVGLQLWRAVPLTRGPLVAFLDDDDQFEAMRLDHVTRVFQADPEIGFYRNRVRLIDLDGEPVSPSLYEATERDALLDRTGPLKRLSGKDPASSRVLQGGYPWFNTSTMVLRRDLLTGRFGQLLETAHHAPDVRLYLIAILSGAGMYIDDRRLTRYRTRASRWEDEARRSAGDLDSVTRTAHLAQKLAPAPWPTQFWTIVREAEKRNLWSDFLSRLEQSRPRAEAISAFAEYLRFLGSHPRAIYFEPSRLFYFTCLVAYLIDPASGNAVLRKALATASINRSRRRAGGDSTHSVT